MRKLTPAGRFWMSYLVALILAIAAVVAGNHAELRTREAQALECARKNNGSDMAIVECYTSRDLPVPRDMY